MADVLGADIKPFDPLLEWARSDGMPHIDRVDDPIIEDFLRQKTREYEYRVASAGNGQERSLAQFMIELNSSSRLMVADAIVKTRLIKNLLDTGSETFNKDMWRDAMSFWRHSDFAVCKETAPIGLACAITEGCFVVAEYASSNFEGLFTPPEYLKGWHEMLDQGLQ